MSPRETRAWLAKFVLKSQDFETLGRLAKILGVAVNRVAVASALLKVRDGFFTEERDAMLVEQWPGGIEKADILIALRALPGPRVCSKKMLGDRVAEMGLRRPVGFSSNGHVPDPAHVEARHRVLVDWNNGMKHSEIATKQGMTLNKLKAILHDWRQTEEFVRWKGGSRVRITPKPRRPRRAG